MRNPRVFRSPNGRLLNVEVSSLRMGLSTCRSIAEEVVQRIQQGDEHLDVELELGRIVDVVRRSLVVAEDEAALDEVGTVLKGK